MKTPGFSENPEVEFPLKYWLSQMSPDEQNIIEVDVFGFNGGILPKEAALNGIRDQERARQIMGRLRQYLKARAEGRSLADLKAEAEDIVRTIDGMLDGGE